MICCLLINYIDTVNEKSVKRSSFVRKKYLQIYNQFLKIVLDTILTFKVKKKNPQCYIPYVICKMKTIYFHYCSKSLWSVASKIFIF